MGNRKPQPQVRIELNEQQREALWGLSGLVLGLLKMLVGQTAVFKQLTGDDGEITGEYKYRDSFEFTPFARLVFSANQPPASGDSSEGFYRRWLVLPFARTFTGSDQIDSRVIDARLSAPQELSGLLNEALKYLHQVRESGITVTPSMQHALDDFRETTDPFAVWLDQNTVIDPNGMVGVKTLRDAYNAQAQQPLSEKMFGSLIRRLRPPVERKQREWQGKPKAGVYMGICLVNSDQTKS